jgi:hypothetical protein
MAPRRARVSKAPVSTTLAPSAHVRERASNVACLADADAQGSVRRWPKVVAHARDDQGAHVHQQRAQLVAHQAFPPPPTPPPPRPRMVSPWPPTPQLIRGLNHSVLVKNEVEELRARPVASAASLARLAT